MPPPPDTAAGPPGRYTDRRDAGRRLARALGHLAGEQPLVLALPRGGVPVAHEVACALHAPLDVGFVRKLAAPGSQELGLGAIADGADPQLVFNDDIVRALRPSAAYIEAERARQLALIEQRKRRWQLTRPAELVRGRLIILVDDGVATGGTARAALQALARNGARRVVLAVPVAPADAQARLGLRPRTSSASCRCATWGRWASTTTTSRRRRTRRWRRCCRQRSSDRAATRGERAR